MADPIIAAQTPTPALPKIESSSPFLRFGATISCVSLKLYLVTCELFDSGDYASFRERLRTMEAKQVLGTQWAVRTTLTANQLKNALREFLADRDRIVVAEIGEERSSRRALSNLSEL
jgi:hypothetical protein